jgi:hypothetical protein
MNAKRKEEILMKKTMITLLAVVLLMGAVIVPVGAAMPEDTIQPLWTNTSSIDCTFNASNGIGYAESVAIGKIGATSVQTDIFVYKNVDGEWIYVTELHDIKYKHVSAVSCTFTAELGGYYRADYTFTVTRAGTQEVVERTVYYTYAS